MVWIRDLNAFLRWKSLDRGRLPSGWKSDDHRFGLEHGGADFFNPEKPLETDDVIPATIRFNSRRE